MKKTTVLLFSIILLVSTIAPPVLAFEELSKGSKGNTVIELQNKLNELGYNVGKADGDFGSKTENVVKEYQMDKGLEPTRRVDENTYSLIFGLPEENTGNTDDTEQGDKIDRNNIQEIWLPGWSPNDLNIITNDGDYLRVSIKDGLVMSTVLASNITSVINIGTSDLLANENQEILSDYLYSYADEIDNEWHDIVIGCAKLYHAVGFRADGTWVTAGKYSDGQCDVDDWTDIIDIRAGAYHTVGLKSDGTVVATGLNDDGQCNVSEWTDIVQIAVDDYNTIGLKADGSVVATGANEYGQCDVSEWKDVKMIHCEYCTIGVTNDGEILTTSDRYFRDDEKCRRIPRKYRCENVKSISGGLVLDWGAILIVKDDNSIDLFGRNDKGECDMVMDFINGKIANQIESAPSQEYSTDNTSYTAEDCTNIALDYMRNHLSQVLKNPSSLQINGTNCVNGDGTTYWITIDYSAMNSFGGYDRNNYYCEIDYTTGKVISGGTIG